MSDPVLEPYDLFLSYNSVDAEIARMIADVLDRRAIKVWMDGRVPFAGERVMNHLVSAVANAAVFVVLLGATGLGSYQSDELEMARSNNKRIVPIWLPGVERTNDGKYGTATIVSSLQFKDSLDEKGVWLELEQCITGALPGELRPCEVEAALRILAGALIEDRVAQRIFVQSYMGYDFPSFSEGEAFATHFRWLSKQTHGAGQLPAVVYLLSCLDKFTGVDEIMRQRLINWQRCVEERTRTIAPHPSTQADCDSPISVDVIIKISPENFQTESEFFVEAWLKEKGAKRATKFYTRSNMGVPRECLPAELSAIIATLFGRRKDLEMNAELNLELFLPNNLLDLPVDTWEVDIGGDVRINCGHVHNVSVRSLDRMYNKKYKATWPRWQNKWRSCQREVSLGAIHVVTCDEDHEIPKHLLLRDEVCAMFALRPPANAALKSMNFAIVSGIPTMIWLRTVLEPMAVADELFRDLGERVQEWPRKMRDLRQRAIAEHNLVWQNASLIYDDPTRLPPDVKFRYGSPARR